MATTKKHVYILPDLSLGNAADFQTGVTDLSLAAMNATVAATGFIEGSSVDLYASATAQTITITPTMATGSVDLLPNNEELRTTIIDVTEGREVFPKRTFSAHSVSDLITAISGAELNPGDGFALSCDAILDSNGDPTGAYKITFPEDRVYRVAINEEQAASTTEVDAVFHKGYTNAEVVEFCKNRLTDVYGRTNRVGFPIVEPNVTVAAGNYHLITVTKDVTRFDKNFGAGYTDQETFYIFMLSSNTIASGSPITD